MIATGPMHWSHWTEATPFNIYVLQKLEYFAEQGELDICLANLANFTYFSLA